MGPPRKVLNRNSIYVCHTQVQVFIYFAGLHQFHGIQCVKRNLRLDSNSNQRSHCGHSNYSLAHYSLDWALSTFHCTRRYGPLCGPPSGFCGGLWPLSEVFFAFQAKMGIILLVFAHVWGSVVTKVTFSSNLKN